MHCMGDSVEWDQDGNGDWLARNNGENLKFGTLPWRPKGGAAAGPPPRRPPPRDPSLPTLVATIPSDSNFPLLAPLPSAPLHMPADHVEH